MRQEDMIRMALELGRPTGIVTFDQLNELLPSDKTEPENIEAVIQALSDEGIDLVEGNEPAPR